MTAIKIRIWWGERAISCVFIKFMSHEKTVVHKMGLWEAAKHQGADFQKKYSNCVNFEITCIIILRPEWHWNYSILKGRRSSVIQPGQRNRQVSWLMLWDMKTWGLAGILNEDKHKSLICHKMWQKCTLLVFAIKSLKRYQVFYFNCIVLIPPPLKLVSFFKS